MVSIATPADTMHPYSPATSALDFSLDRLRAALARLDELATGARVIAEQFPPEEQRAAFEDLERRVEAARQRIVERGSAAVNHVVLASAENQ